MFSHNTQTCKKNLILLFSLLFIVLPLWQGLHILIPILIPTPWATFTTLWQKKNLILYHLPYTFLIAFLGIFLSLIVAFLFAIPMQLLPNAETTIMPWLIILQAIPFIALGPLLLVAFGYGLIAKICITAILCYFPIFLGLFEGMKQIRITHLKMLQSLNFNTYYILFHLRLPNALPHLFTGIRMSVSWVFSAAILAEFLGAQRGLGFLIKSASRSFNNELVFACLIIITLLSLIFFLITRWIEKTLTPWRQHEAS